jgi:hypothetical protein
MESPPIVLHEYRLTFFNLDVLGLETPGRMASEPTFMHCIGML